MLNYVEIIIFYGIRTSFSIFKQIQQNFYQTNNAYVKNWLMLSYVEFIIFLGSQNIVSIFKQNFYQSGINACVENWLMLNYLKIIQKARFAMELRL